MLKRITSLLLTIMLLFTSISALASDETTWNCPNCGHEDNIGNFCGDCGGKRPESTKWICPNCGASELTTDFCTNCGTAQNSEEPWMCPVCGTSGLSSDYCINCGEQKGATKSLNVGDTLYMGVYEQDNLLFNGTEPIEWVVLSVQDDRAMLISKCLLDCKPFSAKYSNDQWEESELRAWLNGTFYDEAFTESEKGMIVDYTSENTTDRVFLLSISEANGLPESIVFNNIQRTEYAKANGLTVDWYWLRTANVMFTTNIALVRGEVDERGAPVNSEYGVRPCIWIQYS